MFCLKNFVCSAWNVKDNGIFPTLTGDDLMINDTTEKSCPDVVKRPMSVLTINVIHESFFHLINYKYVLVLAGNFVAIEFWVYLTHIT